MRLKMIALVALALVSVGVASLGCGEHNTTPAAPANSFMAERVAQTASAQHCDCFAGLGYPSQARCQSDLTPDPLTATQIACVDQLYATAAQTLNSRFLCLEEAHTTFDTCMKGVTGCDATGVTACLDAITTSVAACPALDAATQPTFDTCLTAAP